MKREQNNCFATNIMRSSAILFGMLLLSVNSFGQNKNNLLPPMGWEPWNIDHCGQSSNWDDSYYKELADFFVTSGLKDLGYTYLTFECHAHYRDSNGVFQPNLSKFPAGLRSVNNYLHSKGLKSRTYTDAGKGKCGGCYDGNGSYGYYASDAKIWAEMGFDGVKIDWCGGNKEKLDAKTQYVEFHKEMIKNNPDFNIEICTWGFGNPWEWGHQAGAFWRTGGDIDLYDEGEKRITGIGGLWKALIRNIDANRHPDKNLVGPGLGWNYPDMLIVGIPGGLNETEERTQFSMWCIMASPLFLGNDVLTMPQYAKDILMNKEMIAIDQDPLGIQGDVVKEYNNGNLQVWMKPLKDGSVAVALFNRSEKAETITADWKDLGIAGKMNVRNLLEKEDKGMFTGSYSADVEPHGTVVVKISKK